MEIDRAHDARIVDQKIELGKLLGDFFEKKRNRFGIAHVTLKGMNLGELLLARSSLAWSRPVIIIVFPSCPSCSASPDRFRSLRL